MTTQIWVDADACPVVIRDILYRAAERVGIAITLVANQPIPVPKSPHIKMLQVSAGFDAADNEIVDRIGAGDLLITADIPLAADALNKGAQALSPRGEMFDPSSIKAKLTMRDFMETLRASGEHTGGPPALHARDRKAFAEQLDRYLQRRSQNKQSAKN